MNGNGFGSGRFGGRRIAEMLDEEARTSRQWMSIGDRVRGERAERRAQATRALPFYVSFLDDCLRAIFPRDLVLLGADSGVGKSEASQAIALGNARAGKRVHLLALEAEPKEVERRMKFKLLSEYAYRAGRDTTELNFADWMLFRCDHIVGDLEDEAEYEMSKIAGDLRTYYRDTVFDADKLERTLREIEEGSDLIVIDHFHYVDIEDENENRGHRRIIRLVRDVALEIGIPVVLVVHLRKRDARTKMLTPDLGEIHGSSEIAKICTRAVMITPARKISAPARQSPTFITVPKDRVSGATGLVALCHFDRVLRCYGETYTLGRPKAPGDLFDPLDMDDVPRWAKRHVPMHPGTTQEENKGDPPPTDGDAPQGDLGV